MKAKEMESPLIVVTLNIHQQKKESGLFDDE